MERDLDIELIQELGPSVLSAGEYLSHSEVLKIFMIRNDLDQDFGAFQVVSPLMEGIEDGEEFFVVRIVVEFGDDKGLRVKGDRVHLAVRSNGGKDSRQGIVRSVSFDDKRLAWNVMQENRG